MPSFRLATGDAVAWLKSLPSESVDLVITDPPYESLEKHRARGTTTRLSHSKASSNDWFEIFADERFPELLPEIWRVLRRNSHFYLFCNAETMFVVKPMAEAVGFRFWKPIVWDKCIGSDTPVWTERGVLPAGEVAAGDRVLTPAGRRVSVLATRAVRAPALRVGLSDGSSVLASVDHRFVGQGGEEIEAGALSIGTILSSASLHSGPYRSTLSLQTCVPEEALVLEMPDPTTCLFCGRAFDSVRAAAAHQARFCEKRRSKAEMANEIGVAPKQLRRWMSAGRLPARWAATLGLEAHATGRVRLVLQNDSTRWFPETIRLDHAWGKLIGLFAAEGYRTPLAVSFALHAQEKHLQHHIARTVRQLGLRARIDIDGNRCIVHVMSKLFSAIVDAFVGGTNASTKYFRPIVYEAPDEFRRGVFDGLIEGDGHWSHTEQRETLNTSSLDLACFALRSAREIGFGATIRRHENGHAGFWRVRFDPAKPAAALTVTEVEARGVCDLVDLAIDDPSQLYVLGDGLVSHNCKLGMGYHYRARYEFVLFFEKGKRRLNDLGIPDVLAHERIRGGYPTEKPVSLCEVLVQQSSEPGQVVIDPFMGSGSAGVAAVRCGRRFLGNDLSVEATAVSRGRILAEGGTDWPGEPEGSG